MALSTISSWDPICESYTEDIGLCLINCFCVASDGRLFLDGELELSGLLGEENARDGDWGWLEVALLDLDNWTVSPGKPEIYKH